MNKKSYQYSPSEYKPEDEFPLAYQRYALMILTGQYAQVMEEMATLSMWQNDENLKKLQEKYFYLRRYYISGAEDPTREGFFREIGRELMHLLRSGVLRRTVATDPFHVRTLTERALAEHHLVDEEQFITRLGEVGSLIDEPDLYHPQVELLFDYLWVGDITAKGAEALMNFLHDERQTIAGVNLLGAIYLGMFQAFDEDKFKVIYRVVEQEMRDELLGTALPILLLIGRRYQQELLTQYPEMVQKMQRLISSNKYLQDATYQAIIEIYHTYSTTRDHRIFMENVMPKLEELRSRMDVTNSTNIAEQIQKLTEKFSEEETIELQELMEKAAKRMEDFDATGHDVEYHSMKDMKATPFFSTISHWFLPYDPRHPLIDHEVASMMDEYGVVLFKGKKNIISSDLYSVATFPQWRAVMGQLSQIKDQLPPGESTHYTKSLNDHMRNFLFGAYRFHHLSGVKGYFYNPFDAKPYILDGAFTQFPYLFCEEELLKLASFFAKERHYVAAGSTYERIVAEQGIESGEGWRGIAVTRMIRKDFEGALSALNSAMEAEGMTAVTVTKAAGILDDLGRKDEELELLSRAEIEMEESFPVDLLVRKIDILLSQGSTDKALESAFKAVYLSDRKNEQALLSLSRGLLLAGRAADAYRQLSDDELEDTERISWMRSVAEIAMGERTQGIEALRAIQMQEMTNSEKSEMLSLLSQYGIEPWEQSLILDTTLLKDNF